MPLERVPGSMEDGAASRERLGLSVAAQLDVALVVVDAHLALVWANPAARSGGGCVWAALSAAAPARDEPELRRRLQALVLTCLRRHCPAEALLDTREGPWFASAAPLQSHAGLALVRLNAMHRLAEGACGRLRRLFGLTRAEAEITAQLTDGGSLESIAATRQVSVDTVRAQMRSVFRKTGTHRQGELICAVGRLTAG